ncbi:MAG: response regulator transcription factor [Clostridium sp.]|nr:response regulator transcription factor [Clostridium sp.]
MNSILIVEDDEKLRTELGIFLGNNGYSIKYMDKFDNTISEILNSKCDLILLDINLPGCDGQYICKEIRKTSDIPIIIITSRDTELDELISINYGADDFVAKPFNLQILLARIASILKRVNKTGNEKINCNEFILNTSKSTIEKENKEVELTKNEFKILYYLVSKRNKIVSRDEIMTYLWEGEMFVDDNTLTVNINRLRKKLQDIDLKDIIETKRGQGYILK